MKDGDREGEWRDRGRERGREGGREVEGCVRREVRGM